MASIYSVSQVNAYIKNMFAQDFALNRISIKGEVSNCKYHTSGHIYFTLKDSACAISAVMFAGQRKGLEFRLEEGQKVVVKGSVEVYERDGRYQLYAQEITREGTGDLYERFVKLRNELEEMGMFSPEYKRPIPHYARTIGVVTASTGAAIRDIMNIAARRNPYVQLILYPALVQGERAKYSIAKGLMTLDAMGLDLLIVGRGGGSIEDLWAFNEEMVARAIFHCETPVISAVGHETDVTIADYVADMRAPTPSAAAELAVFDYGQFAEQMNLYEASLRRSISRWIERYRYQAEQKKLHLKYFDPRRLIREKRQRLADFDEKLKALLTAQTLRDKNRIREAQVRLGRLMRETLARHRHRLELLCSRLDGQSPLKKIGGGYGFVTNQDGRRVESIRRVKPEEPIQIALRDGRIDAIVTGTSPYDRTKRQPQGSSKKKRQLSKPGQGAETGGDTIGREKGKEY